MNREKTEFIGFALEKTYTLKLRKLAAKLTIENNKTVSMASLMRIFVKKGIEENEE